jgi:hypothetical protein
VFNGKDLKTLTTQASLPHDKEKRLGQGWSFTFEYKILAICRLDLLPLSAKAVTTLHVNIGLRQAMGSYVYHLGLCFIPCKRNVNVILFFYHLPLSFPPSIPFPLALGTRP